MGGLGQPFWQKQILQLRRPLIIEIFAGTIHPVPRPGLTCGNGRSLYVLQPEFMADRCVQVFML